MPVRPPTHRPYKGTATPRPRGPRLYDTPEWKAARKVFRKANPKCRYCDSHTHVVDHIIPHKGDLKLFWDRSNWQPLCKKHHDSKTATENQAAMQDGRRY